MHTKNNWKAATEVECPSHKLRVLLANWELWFPLIDHLIQERNDRLLSQEDRFLGQYLLPKNLQGLSNDVQDKMYAAYTNDLTDKREYDNEMFRWKTKWLHSTGERRPATLADTLDCINPTLYRNVNTILTILFTMPVSTATPERSFSTMRRVKTYLRATMKTERLSALALMHTYKDITIDGEDAKLRIPIIDLRCLARHSVQ